MPKIKLNDIDMYYEIHGVGEPLVFIAGFSADHMVWVELIDKLKDDFQVIVFDNRGAGQTDVPAGRYSIDVMANDVVALCSNLGIKKAHFIANSMGGFILQTLAYRYPQMVKSAIISNSASTIQSCFNIYVAAQLELLKAAAPRTAVIKALCSWLFSFRFLSQPGMLDYLIEMELENPYPFSLQGYVSQCAALEGFDSSDWVTQIKVPTLVLASNQDLIFSEQLVKSLADKIPKASYFCFSECGHLPQLECSEQFSDVVRKFIAHVNKT